MQKECSVQGYDMIPIGNITGGIGIDTSNGVIIL